MKNKITLKTLLLLLLCTISLSSYAQRNNDKQENIPQHVLKTNVIGYIAGQYQVAYEHVLDDNLSLQLSAGFLTGNASASGYKTSRSGFIFIPEVRYFFGGRAPKRLYVGAFARYRFARNQLTDSEWTSGGIGTNQDLSRKRKTNTIGGGVLLGYQAISRGGFTFDIFAGPQFKSKSTNTVYNNPSLNADATSGDHNNLGDQLFVEKYSDFLPTERTGMGLRFGFSFGYAF